MRMRKKKHGAERIAACNEILIPRELLPTDDPQAFFSEEKPLHLEIGCGKGDFAVGMAAKHPDANWIAVERVSDVACIALEKAMALKESRPDNLRFLIGDARNVAEWFPAASVDCLYLNFSDPWPKKGYAKRRLTYRGFLEVYFRLLKKGGRLCFKTDNVGLFDFTLEELSAMGKTPEFITRDLHADPASKDNVMTEYERNFSSKGFSIHALTLTV